VPSENKKLVNDTHRTKTLLHARFTSRARF
jgi:hypothetical protein